MGPARLFIPILSNGMAPMFTRFRLTANILVLSSLMLLAGCGGSSDDGDLVIVKGKLLENGKPFVLDESKLPLPKGVTAPPPGSEPVRIVFIHLQSKEQFPAKFYPESSSFEVKGTNGKGIKPGRYRISVMATYSLSPPNRGNTQSDNKASNDGKTGNDTKTQNENKSGDYFGEKFTKEKSPINRDVKAGEEIIVDVAKP
jgi:hypothetical protein